ncbi:Tetratricopeptide repeat-containing protein [Niabella drilacis]|uniref:Tetratricopeptide repeat-containing protein n=2 Tax=Niabella drilacis (strain DSM 25811 / CCM 8410 / CCUG 62505 / LMG 26954 / E90) TaxID=1285928 RepID=A0A1G6U1R0_NIADE|nr:Tetratricopeptide repeat-containing protein [Niabella drilacis]
MKGQLLLTGFLLLLLKVQGQDTSRIKLLMMEGIRFHDQGQYADAVKKYDSVLGIDPDHVIAQYEKSYSLMASKNYKQAIELSQVIIKSKRADSSIMGNAYSTWGAALDEQGDHQKALKVYEEGIREVPGNNMLNYNKAITYLRMNQIDAGISELEASLSKNPVHLSSHFMLGRTMLLKNNKIAALMPYMTYLLLDNRSKRAEDALGEVRRLVEGNAKKTDSNTYHIEISRGALKKRGHKRPADDDFQSISLLFELGGAADASKTEGLLPADRFAGRLASVIELLAGQTGHSGFYGSVYLPFFRGLHEQKLVESFAHHIFSPSGNVMNEVWIQDHREQMEQLRVWTQAYRWPGAGF